MTKQIFVPVIWLLSVICLVSCIESKVKNFSEEDLKWFKPFSKTDTAVYQSAANEFDTIIFSRAEMSKSSTSKIEQGYYNTNSISVQFKLTKGSYHQFAILGDNNDYRQDIFRISNSSSGNGKNFEIYFLGILYSDKALQSITKLDTDRYYFDKNKATYGEVNIKEGINSFTFSLTKGVTQFVDKRNIKWIRK